MARIPVGAHKLRTYRAVADVRLRAVTTDGRSIGPEDADVVEHCRFADELQVYVKLRMAACQLQGLVSDAPAVGQQDASQLVIGRIILVYLRIWECCLRASHLSVSECSTINSVVSSMELRGFRSKTPRFTFRNCAVFAPKPRGFRP